MRDDSVIRFTDMHIGQNDTNTQVVFGEYFSVADRRLTFRDPLEKASCCTRERYLYSLGCPLEFVVPVDRLYVL